MDYLYDDNSEWGRYNWQPMEAQAAPEQPHAPEPVDWGQLNPPPNVPGGWEDEHTGGFVPENSGNAGGYQDLSYWASRGTPADEIFDFNTGQTRDGWTRTGSGYERTYNTGPNGPDANPNPNPRIPNPSPMPTMRQVNIGDPPPFPRVGLVNYAPFKAPDPFKAPSAADMLKDPGFEFRRSMGEDAIKRQLASMGKLRTGGAAKGLIDYNQNFASLEYGNVYERAANEYDRIYNNLMGEYKVGYQQALDRSDQEFRLASAEYNPKFSAWQDAAAWERRQAELDYLRDQNIWETVYNAGAK